MPPVIMNALPKFPTSCVWTLSRERSSGPCWNPMPRRDRKRRSVDEVLAPGGSEAAHEEERAGLEGTEDARALGPRLVLGAERIGQRVDVGAGGAMSRAVCASNRRAWSRAQRFSSVSSPVTAGAAAHAAGIGVVPSGTPTLGIEAE